MGILEFLICLVSAKIFMVIVIIFFISRRILKFEERISKKIDGISYQINQLFLDTRSFKNYLHYGHDYDRKKESEEI